MFHNVGDDGMKYNVSVEMFRQFMTHIYKKNIIRLVDWEESETDFYALTFDDVPESFYKNAYPILKEFNIPFTIFVSIDLLDKPGFITTSQLIELSKCSLCTVGSHGNEHKYVSNLSIEEFESDIIQAKEFLQYKIGRQIDLYAFPYGSFYACGFRKQKHTMVAYKYAFSTIPICITSPLILSECFLPRINVDEKLIASMLNEKNKRYNTIL